jgi:hypothetical protein
MTRRLSVKLYPGYGGRMKCLFRLQDQVNGGILAGAGASTDFIPLSQPTNAQFILPKAHIFLGGQSSVTCHSADDPWAKCFPSSRYPWRANR